MAQLLGRQRAMALEVDDVELRGDTAVAHANITIIDDQGDRVRSRYTMLLVHGERGWHVRFQQ